MAAPKLLVLSLLLLPLLPEATAARASSDSDQRQPEYGGGDSNGTRLETEWSRHRHHHNRHHHHHHHHHHRPHHRAQEEVKLKRMFVFGDSYADTGNNKPSDASSWKFPYGTTFPGYPSGRFSDGRVFTDLLASYLGLKSPVSYRMVKRVPSIHLLNGVNFAFGGTGVFDTLVSNPNMSVQIDYFEALITGPHVYSAADIHSSIALLTNSGNDYSAYMARNGSANTITDFIQQVVDRLSKNLKRIHALGVRKIVVAGLQPLGCLPENTYKFWFNDCSNEINMLVSYHNTLLEKAVAQLNNATGPSTFVMIDFFNAFSSILQGKENTSFTSPLKPCCMGVSSDYFCSDVAKNGTKMYTVCVDPSSSFFWDMAHPTQAGWHAVISAIGSNLKQL